MNPGVAIRGRGLQVLEEIVHAAFADGAGALLHRPIGELAQRSEYSAKGDAAAATSSSPNGRLRQCSPMNSGRKFGKTVSAFARSAALAKALIQRPYCSLAAGTSPFQP